MRLCVYIKDGDDTDGTLRPFRKQTAKQVPTERRQEEEKDVSDGKNTSQAEQDEG